MNRKIVFYNDSAVYGGHEVMFLAGLASIIKRSDLIVYIFYSKYNTRLAYEIKNLSDGCCNVVLLPLDIRSRSFQAVLSFIMRKTVSKLAKRLKAIAPERVVLIQGNIEISSLGLLAAKKAGCYCISYIPMVNILASARNRFMGILKYPFISALYRKPERFITISDTIADDLRHKAPGSEVDVVYNGVDYSRYRKIPRSEARKTTGLPKGVICIGIVGRITFSQKGHDIIVDFVRKRKDRLENILFVIVGTGPDEQKLRKMVSKYDLERFFEFIPWTDKISEVLSGLDALLLPSRYEGIPVIAIEALKFDIPVLVSSKIVALKDFLPARFFFNTDDYDSILSIIHKLPICGKNSFAEMRQLFSVKLFPGNFSNAVMKNRKK